MALPCFPREAACGRHLFLIKPGLLKRLLCSFFSYCSGGLLSTINLPWLQESPTWTSLFRTNRPFWKKIAIHLTVLFDCTMLPIFSFVHISFMPLTQNKVFMCEMLWPGLRPFTRSRKALRVNHISPNVLEKHVGIDWQQLTIALFAALSQQGQWNNFLP